MPTDPEKQKRLAEAIRQRKMQEQMGDIEFQMDIAPYFGYTGPIDPSVARSHQIKGLSGKTDLTMGGFHVLPEQDMAQEEMPPIKGSADGLSFEIKPEIGTVNAIHNKATPNIWAHEYRHLRSPGLSEGQNRMVDAANAMTEEDWNAAVRMWRDQMRRNGEDPTMSEAELALVNSMVKINSTGYAPWTKLWRDEYENGATLPATEKGYFDFDDASDYAEWRLKNSLMNQKVGDRLAYEEWNEGLKERNKKRREVR